MKHVREELVPERTITVTDHYTCDLCGEKIREPDVYETSDRSIERQIGHNYPEGEGDSKTENTDICDACWDSKLVPWLASQGVSLRIEEHSW